MKGNHSLASIDQTFGRVLRHVCVGIFIVLFFLVALNVIVRFVPIVSLGWYDEIIELLIAWMVFLGAAALWREKEHFAVTFLPEALKNKSWGCVLSIIINLTSLLFLLIFTYYSLNLTIRANDWTPVLVLPKRLLYVIMPISGIIMILYSLRDIVQCIYSISRRSITEMDRSNQ